MNPRTDKYLSEKLSRTRAADAAHADMMNFFAEAFGCKRDDLVQAMKDASKKRLDAIMAKYEARKEAA